MNEVKLELTMPELVELVNFASEHGLSVDEVVNNAVAFSLAQEKSGANKPANSALGAIAETTGLISQLFSDLTEQISGLKKQQEELPCFLRK